MQAIKALVIFMGILLIAGLGLLGYGMYTKAGRSVKPSAPAAMVTTPSALADFGALGLDQPVGTRIVGVQVTGPVLTVQLTEGGRPDRVAVVDLAAGRVLGVVSLDGAAATPEAPTAQ